MILEKKLTMLELSRISSLLKNVGGSLTEIEYTSLEQESCYGSQPVTAVCDQAFLWQGDLKDDVPLELRYLDT